MLVLSEHQIRQAALVCTSSSSTSAHLLPGCIDQLTLASAVLMPSCYIGKVLGILLEADNVWLADAKAQAQMQHLPSTGAFQASTLHDVTKPSPGLGEPARVYLPYALPLTKYGPDNEPWKVDVPHIGLDSHNWDTGHVVAMYE